MQFIPISIDDYVIRHLKNNPNEKEKDLRQGLNSALEAFKKGVKCSCGNDIWVIGSAAVGNSCFTCITGERYPKDDYEIESAIKKESKVSGRRHIDNIPPSEINGFFDDDGYEINMDLIQKPSLCLTCINNDNPNEELLCNMTRHDQQNEHEFICFAYREKK